jgi:hypothetical protein
MAIHSDGYAVTCDSCGELGEEITETKALARKAVKQIGWAYTRGKDLCSACRIRKPKGWDDATWKELRDHTTRVKGMSASERQSMHDGLIAGVEQS